MQGQYLPSPLHTFMGNLRKFVRGLEDNSPELSELEGSEPQFHYWYSAQQDAYLEARVPNYSHKYILINGKRVKFTSCAPSKDNPPVWDDIKYLGTSYQSLISF